ncbi:zinc finger CCCH domain-containing protein 3 [Dorcoceras hygrometricum]|nr:zinc finger CCCH domain-containing protein 3 [Dorcoceras hygrometricum]
MPLGKYYCDYCDKEFQDTTTARRRHLQGIQHQRAKAAWYSPQRTNIVNNAVIYWKVLSFHPLFVSCTRVIVELFCSKTSLYDVLICLFDIIGVMGSQFGTSLGNLPPSLCPPPEGGYPPLPFIDWG